jgi:hypothetical protein
LTLFTVLVVLDTLSDIDTAVPVLPAAFISVVLLVEAALSGAFGVLLTFGAVLVFVEIGFTALGAFDAVFRVETFVVVERRVPDFVVVDLLVVVLIDVDLVDVVVGLLLSIVDDVEGVDGGGAMDVVEDVIGSPTGVVVIGTGVLEDAVVELVADVDTAALADVAEAGRGGATSSGARFT